MATLENSTRRLLQAVFTPVKLPPEERETLDFGAIKWGLVAALNLTGDDFAKLRSHLEMRRRAEELESEAVQDMRQSLDALEGIVDRPGEMDYEEAVASVAPIEAGTLAELTKAVIELRETELKDTEAALDRLSRAVQERTGPGGRGAEGAIGSGGRPPEGPTEEGWSVLPSVARVRHPPEGFEAVGRIPRSGATLFRRVLPVPPPERVGVQRAGSRDDGGQTLELLALDVGLGAAQPPMLRPEILLRPRPVSVGEIIARAQGAGLDAGDIEMVQRSGSHFILDFARLPVADLQVAGGVLIDNLYNVLASFTTQMKIEPVGLLHLERVTFTPAGIERGELVYSVPLAPGEEVNIAHKEWSHTSEEFQRIVTDFMEEFSEEGVSEKAELAQSSSSQQQHSNGINVGVSATGGYGPVSVTSSFGFSVSDSASSSESFSRNQSITVTRKASSRTKKEHKVSFKVASAAGTEDQTVRKLQNPFPDRASRVDYYQLIRKWEVNVYRYGIRLTYELTLPEPGSDVLSKIVEIQDLEDALQEGFGAPDAAFPWAKFDLTPDEITRDNYASKAAEYGAAAPTPPPELQYYEKVGQHSWGSSEEAGHTQNFTLEVDVDENYQVSFAEGWRLWSSSFEGDDDYRQAPKQGAFQDWLEKSGKLTFVYRARLKADLAVKLVVYASLRDSAELEWKLAAWNAMRDAARARYQEQRQAIKERLSQLREELGAQDALSLRKFEREEIMKGVVRWLFGPGFTFVPPGTPPELYSATQAVKTEYLWSKTLRHGEFIKFLHHAIEWENMLYFLYPYFWSHIGRWELKKYLSHPDPTHQAFLKAGSARVVLTIRPGFELDFMSLLEKGQLDALPQDHPYVTIIEEMQNYAQTNYPGIPPANPEQTEEIEQGVKIGTWYEYTPTSALDIAFDETLPTA